MPLWPSGPPDPVPPPSAPPSPTSFDDPDVWPDPPGQLWPAYEKPARRRRRTVPIVLGVLAAVLLVAAGAAGALLLTHRAVPTANTAAPAPAATTAGPTAAAGPSTAASPSVGPSPSGGSFSTGDCLEVTSTTSGALDNAKLVRQDCAGPHFATVRGRVATKADCAADATISRIDDAGQMLCLGQDARGAIARPGDCVRVPTTFALPLIRTDCAAAGTTPFRLEAIVDDPTQCPTGTRGAPYSGYDRVLCVRFP